MLKAFVFCQAAELPPRWPRGTKPNHTNGERHDHRLLGGHVIRALSDGMKVDLQRLTAGGGISPSWQLRDQVSAVSGVQTSSPA